MDSWQAIHFCQGQSPPCLELRRLFLKKSKCQLCRVSVHSSYLIAYLQILSSSSPITEPVLICYFKTQRRNYGLLQMFQNTQATIAAIVLSVVVTRPTCLCLNSQSFVKLKLHSLWLVKLPFKRINGMIWWIHSELLLLQRQFCLSSYAVRN